MRKLISPKKIEKAEIASAALAKGLNNLAAITLGIGGTGFEIGVLVEGGKTKSIEYAVLSPNNLFTYWMDADKTEAAISYSGILPRLAPSRDTLKKAELVAPPWGGDPSWAGLTYYQWPSSWASRGVTELAGKTMQVRVDGTLKSIVVKYAQNVEVVENSAGDQMVKIVIATDSGNKYNIYTKLTDTTTSSSSIEKYRKQVEAY